MLDAALDELDISGLKSWQPEAALTLKRALEKHGGALDGSSTGVGKSFHAGALIRYYDLPTLVVCPKISITHWQRVAAHFNTEIDVLNIEKIRGGKTLYGCWKKDDKGRCFWEWAKEIKFLVIDESHRFRGIRTQNGNILWGAKRQRIPTLCLSATPAISPLDMRALGYLLGLHNGKNFWLWARNHGCEVGPFRNFIFTGRGWETRGGQVGVMNKLGAELFPERGVRLRAEDIPSFPENCVTAELLNLKDAALAERLYSEMAGALEDLRAAKARDRDPENPRTRLLRAHQEFEIVMVPLVAEMAQDALDQGHAVLVFCRFKRTLFELAKVFKTQCLIHGDQTREERDACIDAFQADREHLILATIDAGSESFGAHDLHGNYPRRTFLLPGFDARKFLQALGRAPRVGGLTKVVQSALFPDTPIGRALHKNVSRKLNNLDALIDQDLDPSNLVLANAA